MLPIRSILEKCIFYICFFTVCVMSLIKQNVQTYKLYKTWICLRPHYFWICKYRGFVARIFVIIYIFLLHKTSGTFFGQWRWPFDSSSEALHSWILSWPPALSKLLIEKISFKGEIFRYISWYTLLKTE